MNTNTMVRRPRAQSVIHQELKIGARYLSVNGFNANAITIETFSVVSTVEEHILYGKRTMLCFRMLTEAGTQSYVSCGGMGLLPESRYNLCRVFLYNEELKEYLHTHVTSKDLEWFDGFVSYLLLIQGTLSKEEASLTSREVQAKRLLRQATFNKRVAEQMYG